MQLRNDNITDQPIKLSNKGKISEVTHMPQTAKVACQPP